MPHQNRPDLQRFLDRLTSRSFLSEAEQQAILNLPIHAAQVQANRDFVALNQTVDHACLVVEGIVGCFGQNAEGERQITALHIAGDMPDLHSVVQPKSHSALQALSTATIVRVPHRALRAIAGRYPAIAEAFWRRWIGSPSRKGGELWNGAKWFGSENSMPPTFRSTPAPKSASGLSRPARAGRLFTRLGNCRASQRPKDAPRFLIIARCLAAAFGIRVEERGRWVIENMVDAPGLQSATGAGAAEVVALQGRIASHVTTQIML